MDTITHGIAGALISKAFFDGEDLFSLRSPTAGRAVTLAATLGAMFPDVDIVRDILSSNPLSILTSHRGATHSLLMLPLFTLILAAISRWLAKRFAIPSPSLAKLVLIYAVGIASHIVLDLITSFGTMVWWPLVRTRVAWDLIFIIDLMFTGLFLLPQFVSSLYREQHGFSRRALRTWLAFSFCAALSGWLLTLESFPPATWAMLAVIVAVAILVLAPAIGGWGFRVQHKNWNRAGVLAGAAYLGLAVMAQHTALSRVQQFAAQQKIIVQNIGALPLPPSPANWDGLIRTAHGVYELRLSLWQHFTPASDDPLEYNYFPDTPRNEMLATALKLPEVQTYLWFARFPVFRWHKDGTTTVLEFADLRFFQRRNRSSFTYVVTFDANGRIVESNWLKK